MPHWEIDTFLDMLCRCGAGRFIAWHRSENYPPFRGEFGSWVDCPVCSRGYRIYVRGYDDVRLCRLADDAAAAARWRERSQRTEALWHSEPVQQLRKLLTDWLDTEPTKIGKYRLLQSRGLVDGPLSRFRRDFTTTEDAAQHALVMNARRFPALAELRRQVVAIRDEPEPAQPFEQLAQREHTA